MKTSSFILGSPSRTLACLIAGSAVMAAAPAAGEEIAERGAEESNKEGGEQTAEEQPQPGAPPVGGPDVRGPQAGPPSGPPSAPPGGLPPGVRPGGPPGAGGPPFKPVFDDTWISLGIGAGLVPSYTGSDDYVFFPLPLIVGRVGGVGLRPNGPGLSLDLLSKVPSGRPSTDPTFSFGPTFRIRNDRVAQIEDEVVEQLEDLDLAIELGLAGGVSIPGLIHRADSVSVNVQARRDVAGAHAGFLVEPSIGYISPLGRSTLINLSFGLQFVDDNFAEYYYTVTPGQAAASGLPVFEADGGLNSASATLIVNRDLDGNALNGGLSIYAIGGYSRLIGDGADTPFTNVRGSADQFIGGIGLAYTF